MLQKFRIHARTIAMGKNKLGVAEASRGGGMEVVDT
jgi:hypothetical protein